jgi:hypothetical protein
MASSLSFRNVRKTLTIQPLRSKSIGYSPGLFNAFMRLFCKQSPLFRSAFQKPILDSGLTRGTTSQRNRLFQTPSQYAGQWSVHFAMTASHSETSEMAGASLAGKSVVPGTS